MNWNLELLYESLDDPQIDKDIRDSEKAIETFITKWKDNKEYLEDPKILKRLLDDYEKIFANMGIFDKPYYYFALTKELDLNNKDLKARLNKLSHKLTKLKNELQIFRIPLSKIPKEKQKEFINSEDLKEYKHYLESLFKIGKYLLSDAEEGILSLTAKVSFDNWVNMVEELLSKQTMEIIDEDLNKKEVSYNEIFKYLASTNKEIRDNAVKELNKVNKKYIEIAEYEMNSILEKEQILDDKRGIKRADLVRHLDTDVDSQIVDSLIEIVTKNFNISRDYYKKKAKLLGQKSIGYHERNVPIGNIDKEYKFEDGIQIVKETFYNLDKEFGDILSEYIKNGQIDAFPKANKTGGAYCIKVNKNLPTYILLNYNNKVNDVLTIAHESGHGIHSELASNQNSLNEDYSLAIAEVASTFFEDFVLERILKQTDDTELIKSLKMQKMNDTVNTIFRQVAFYNFEKELHSMFRREGYLSHEDISEVFVKHMHDYLGDAVDIDDSMRYGWIYVSHFRRFFYVYTYASGLLISKYLQKKVREDKNFINNFKKLLEIGSYKSVKDIFKDVGIDISKKAFWEEGINSLKTN
jgi:oligoendopeptidase F